MSDSHGFVDGTTPTIYDVARHADVSASSVSRVINDNTSVTEDIRRRVLASIQELEYRPDEVARVLGRRNKSGH